MPGYSTGIFEEVRGELRISLRCWLQRVLPPDAECLNALIGFNHHFARADLFNSPASWPAAHCHLKAWKGLPAFPSHTFMHISSCDSESHPQSAQSASPKWFSPRLTCRQPACAAAPPPIQSHGGRCGEQGKETLSEHRVQNRAGTIDQPAGVDPACQP